MMTLIKLIPAALAFAFMAWFVSFQFNPYKWCDDHPDAAKSKKYFICEPFGIEVEKGTWLERNVDHRFAGENKKIYVHKNNAPTKKQYDCQDSNVLLTKEGYDYCMGKTSK